MEESKSIWNKRAPATIVGVLIIGIVCSAIYDVLIKPGINSFSDKLFNLVTLGSESIKDYAFSNAALDPTSIPSIILLFMFAGLVAGLSTGIEIIKLIKSKKENRESSSPSKIRKTLSPALSLINTIIIFVYITTVNQSVLVWRAFNANLQIAAPYLTEKKRYFYNQNSPA